MYKGTSGAGPPPGTKWLLRRVRFCAGASSATVSLTQDFKALHPLSFPSQWKSNPSCFGSIVHIHRHDAISLLLAQNICLCSISRVRSRRVLQTSAMLFPVHCSLQQSQHAFSTTSICTELEEAGSAGAASVDASPPPPPPAFTSWRRLRLQDFSCFSSISCTDTRDRDHRQDTELGIFCELRRPFAGVALRLVTAKLPQRSSHEPRAFVLLASSQMQQMPNIRTQSASAELDMPQRSCSILAWQHWAMDLANPCSTSWMHQTTIKSWVLCGAPT